MKHSQQAERTLLQFCMTQPQVDTLKTHKDLVKAIGSKTPPQATIRRWRALFRSEGKDKKTATHLSRQKTASNEEKAFAAAESSAPLRSSVRHARGKLYTTSTAQSVRPPTPSPAHYWISQTTPPSVFSRLTGLNLS